MLRFLLVATGLLCTGAAHGAEKTPKPAKTPVGAWRWFNARKIIFEADGNVHSGSNDLHGFWATGNATPIITVKWDFGAIDSLTLSADGRTLLNAKAGRDTMGVRIPTRGEAADSVNPPAAAPTAAATGSTTTGMIVPTPNTPGVAPVAEQSPVGKWHWFNHQQVTFQADGKAVPDKGKPGTWTRAASGEIIIAWKNGHADNLVLSADGRHLTGHNEDGREITAERIKSGDGAAADPSQSTTPEGKSYFGARRPGTVEPTPAPGKP